MGFGQDCWSSILGPAPRPRDEGNPSSSGQTCETPPATIRSAPTASTRPAAWTRFLGCTNSEGCCLNACHRRNPSDVGRGPLGLAALPSTAFHVLLETQPSKWPVKAQRFPIGGLQLHNHAGIRVRVVSLRRRPTVGHHLLLACRTRGNDSPRAHAEAVNTPPLHLTHRL